MIQKDQRMDRETKIRGGKRQKGKIQQGDKGDCKRHQGKGAVSPIVTSPRDHKGEQTISQIKLHKVTCCMGTSILHSRERMDQY